MDFLSPFEDESVIMDSNDNSVLLTTHRIRYKSNQGSKSHITSIMLKNISSIEIHYKSNQWLFYVGITFLITGIVMSPKTGLGYIGLGIGLLMMIIYWFTRRHVVSICSNGGASIDFQTKGMKQSALIDFIDTVEENIYKNGR